MLFTNALLLRTVIVVMSLAAIKSFLQSRLGGFPRQKRSSSNMHTHGVLNRLKIDPMLKLRLLSLERASSRGLLSQLSPDNALGYCSDKGAAKAGSMLHYITTQKEKHPDKIVLTRCGEFYETYGVDAVMMVEHAGLNPMGGKPKAGCPVGNIQQTLDSLTDVGLTVAVYEEYGDADAVAAIKTPKYRPKLRKLSQIVTSSQSTYLYNLCLRYQDIDFKTNDPIISLMSAPSGYSLAMIYLDEQRMQIYSRLTAESVRVLIRSAPHSYPVYIQQQDKDLSTSNKLDLASLFLPLDSNLNHLVTVKKISGYKEKDFHEHVLRRIGRSLEISTSTLDRFNRNVQSSSSTEGITTGIVDGELETERVVTGIDDTRARPVYVSTALQIGLLPNDNVPALIPSLLSPCPSSAVSTSNRRFLHKWILNPPSTKDAATMSTLCKSLSDLTQPLPPCPLLSLGKTVSLLSARETNVQLFNDIFKSVHHVQHTLDVPSNSSEDQKATHSGVLQQIVRSMLSLVAVLSGYPTSHEALHSGCGRILKHLRAVVACDTYITDDDVTFSDSTHSLVPDDFFNDNERIFRKKVIPSHPLIAPLYESVHRRGKELCNCIARELTDNAGDIVYDRNNNIIVSKKPPKDIDKESAHAFKAQDRRGAVISNRYTTSNVNAALELYVKEAKHIMETVRTLLQELCDKLCDDLVTLKQTAHWSILLNAAESHVRNSIQKGWSLPPDTNTLSSVSERSEERSGELNVHPSPSVKLELQGLIPYWMEQEQAVSNDISLHGLYLLTAPNMSGKSTLMRSVLVAALLGNCGLYVPCVKTKNELSRNSTNSEMPRISIPRYDNFFLRTSSYDVPTESKSAFALEMDDVSVVLRDCTNKSLVMIDEIGKGTSSREGAALAGAILEELDQRNYTGIFATHLHEVFQLPLQLTSVVNKTMAFGDDGDGALQWKFQVVDGACTDSLALHTAALYSLPPTVLSRAAALAKVFDRHCRTHENVTSERAAYSLKASPQSNNVQLEQIQSKVWNLVLRNSSLWNSVNSLSSEDDMIIIEKGCAPPPLLEGRSCVYILHLTNDAKAFPDTFYIGETEGIFQRLQQHRASPPVISESNILPSADGYTVRALVIPLPNKSSARRLENLLIRTLKDNVGLDICNKANGDETHRLFSRG